MTGRTRERNQARLVRCSASCGALVWLAGALPTTADDLFVCATCTAARLRANAQLVEENADDYHAQWTAAVVEAGAGDCGHQCCVQSDPGHLHTDRPAACPDCDRLERIAEGAEQLAPKTPALDLLDAINETLAAAAATLARPHQMSGRALRDLDRPGDAEPAVAVAALAPPAAPCSCCGGPDHCPHCWATDTVPLAKGLRCTNDWHHAMAGRS